MTSPLLSKSKKKDVPINLNDKVLSTDGWTNVNCNAEREEKENKRIKSRPVAVVIS